MLTVNFLVHIFVIESESSGELLIETERNLKEKSTSVAGINCWFIRKYTYPQCWISSNCRRNHCFNALSLGFLTVFVQEDSSNKTQAVYWGQAPNKPAKECSTLSNVFINCPQYVINGCISIFNNMFLNLYFNCGGDNSPRTYIVYHKGRITHICS